MSSFENMRRGRVLLALASALALGGCFRPVYADRGPVASVSGGTVSSELAAIDILPVDGRVAQRIRNDLIFAFTGGGAPATPVYRLDMSVQIVAGQTAIVDSYTNRPALETAGVEVAYTLVRVGTGEPVLSSNALGRATYTRNRQRFASMRALRDAEDRAAKVAVEQIRAKILSHFATAG